MSNLTGSDNTTYITLAGAAELLGKTTKEMTVHAKAGDFGAKKIGKGWIFDRDRIGLMSVDDVAKLLQVNVQTVRRWARDKVYPAVRIGRRYYFTLEALSTMH